MIFYDISQEKPDSQISRQVPIKRKEKFPLSFTIETIIYFNDNW